METKTTIAPTDAEIVEGYLRATTGEIDTGDKVRVQISNTDDIETRLSDVFYRDLLLFTNNKLDTIIVNTMNQAYKFAEYNISHRAPVMLRRAGEYESVGLKSVSITSSSLVITKEPTDAEVEEVVERFRIYKSKPKNRILKNIDLAQIRYCELTKLPGKWFIQFSFLVLP